MSASRNDRFARLAALKPARKRNTTLGRGTTHLPSACPGNRGDSDRLAELLGAVVARNRYGEHLQVRRWFSSPEAFPAGPEANAPAARALQLLLPRRPDISSGAHQRDAAALDRLADPAEWLFLDTETTGLAGGTGTYAFLVGLAWWDAGGLQVEQFFMRDYGEEHSLLLELSRHLAERRVLVTFNGKTFDWPLLETRYLMTRAIAPRPPATHLDMLHPARQLWRLRLGSVRLIELERHVLGAERLGWDRGDDIDSAFIPQIYFDYLRGGPPEPLADVFRHNQMDLRGLATLAGRIVALLSEPEALGGAENDALELYGISRLLHRRGEAARARLLYERALGAGLPRAADRAARRELALLSKRERDYERATSLWQDLLQSSDSRRGRACPAPGPASDSPTRDLSARGCLTEDLGTSLEAYEQLAIYYEHHAREPARAAALTRQALSTLRKAMSAAQIEPGRYRRLQARLEHRLARLTRIPKPRDGRPLFEPASLASRGRARESNREAKNVGTEGTFKV